MDENTIRVISDLVRKGLRVELFIDEKGELKIHTVSRKRVHVGKN